VSALSLRGVRKSYGSTPVLLGVDLDVPVGSVTAVLGPSGCGKTTMLRLIAGFDDPDAGTIALDGEIVAGAGRPRPPQRRRVGYVPQEGALFPHLSVAANVAFGLSRKEGAGPRVAEVLELVGLPPELAARQPHELSGGQQQRVALARALVLNPTVLLLDEPLGALDAKLRKHLQLELKAIQQSVGVTFVYVTHDQEEALTMSDRLAVMRDGLVQQVGAPEAVYSAPRTAYVAGFLGSANVLDVAVLDAADGDPVACRLGALPLTAVGAARRGPGKVIVRPERITLTATDRPAAAPPGHNAFHGVVDKVVYLGPTTHVVVRLADGQTLLVAVPNVGEPMSSPFVAGCPVHATFPPEAARLLADEAVDQPNDPDDTAVEPLPPPRSSAAAGPT
jgi:spermidine/putrescine transport system ATP-binding protein